MGKRSLTFVPLPKLVPYSASPILLASCGFWPLPSKGQKGEEELKWQETSCLISNNMTGVKDWRLSKAHLRFCAASPSLPHFPLGVPWRNASPTGHWAPSSLSGYLTVYSYWDLWPIKVVLMNKCCDNRTQTCFPMELLSDPWKTPHHHLPWWIPVVQATSTAPLPLLSPVLYISHRKSGAPVP